MFDTTLLIQPATVAWPVSGYVKENVVVKLYEAPETKQFGLLFQMDTEYINRKSA